MLAPMWLRGHNGRMDSLLPWADAPQLKLRIVFGEGAMLGPGKVLLLERIRETGSIAAAGRTMGMSYKRAWSLVEELNRMFKAPLVGSARGGAQGGGAWLTESGEAVLGHYQKLQDIAQEAGALRIAQLQAMLADIPHEK